MSYELIPTPIYEKSIKNYYRKKKFTKIYDDLAPVLELLEKGTLLGDKIADLKLGTSHSVYKLRISNSNINKGKSSGYRLIYYVVSDEGIIYLLNLYFKKSDNDVIDEKEIRDIIEKYIN